MLAGSAVYYRTRIQPTIAQSSTEAEFTNMADAGKAALYLKWILKELGIIMQFPTPIYTDNQGTIKLFTRTNTPNTTCRNETLHYTVMD